MATRWPDTIPLMLITAKTVADAMIVMFGRTGVPTQILSDHMTQFFRKLAKDFCQLLGIEKIRTTVYYTQSYGALEHFHGTLESMLAKGEY